MELLKNDLSTKQLEDVTMEARKKILFLISNKDLSWAELGNKSEAHILPEHF